MIAAAELSPEAIERSGLVYPEEQEETQIMTSGDYYFERCPPGNHWESHGGVSLCVPDAAMPDTAPPPPPPAPHMAGFDLPLTDYYGNLLVAAHPFHPDYPWPPTFGGPVLTGWDAPLTDAYGRLLIGPGQYGTFTVPNPWDHRTWDDVDLEMIDTEGDPQWFVVGQDDIGTALGSIASSALSSLGSSGGGGGAGGGSSGGDIGSALGSIFSSDSSGGGSSGGGSDIGSVLGSIATTAAKAAIPVLAKAGSQAISQAMQQSQQTQAPPAPVAHVPPGHPAHPANQQHAAMNALLGQVNTLGKKYGIARPTSPHPRPTAGGAAT